jgi:hypothetical protein
MAVEVVVIFLLVSQAAEQTAADAGNFGGIDRKSVV